MLAFVPFQGVIRGMSAFRACCVQEMSDLSDLRAVPLYTHVNRVARGLAARGIGPDDAIPTAELFALDQWHYHGTDAIRDAGAFLGLGPTSRVLDIGSGIGGPARFLAHTTGCHVTALEIQPELHRVGLDLTQRSGLADRVTHQCGDALAVALPAGAFDAVISFLAILHVDDRPGLFRKLFSYEVGPDPTVVEKEVWLIADTDCNGEDIILYMPVFGMLV